MYIVKVPLQLLFNQLIYGSCNSATFIDALKQIDYLPCCKQTYGCAGHNCTIENNNSGLGVNKHTSHY